MTHGRRTAGRKGECARSRRRLGRGQGPVSQCGSRRPACVREEASRGGVRAGRSEFRLRHNRTGRQNCFFPGPATTARRFRDGRLKPKQFWTRVFPARRQCACARPSRPTEGERGRRGGSGGARERAAPGAAVTRGLRRAGAPRKWRGTANPRPARPPRRPIGPRLAPRVSRRGRFSITLGCVGRWPGIKDSARAGGRHSGVRLEVSLGVPSLGG